MSNQVPLDVSQRFGKGFWLRAIIVAVVDAGVVFALPILITERSWTLLALLSISALLLNYAYLSPRAQALRWLSPGLVFMLMFVIWPVIFTAYIALTNWSTGHVLTKDQVIENLEGRSIEATGEGVDLALSLYQDPTGELGLYLTSVTSEGTQTFFGNPRTSDEPRVAEDGSNLLSVVELGATDEDGDGIPERIGDYQILGLRDIISISNQLEGLELDLPGGVAQVVSASTARLVAAGQRYTYDPETDTLYDAQLDVVCSPEEGSFTCPGEISLDPGWRVVIGWDNFSRIFTDDRFRGPLLGIFLWNIIFAVGSVILTFAVGLTLANALQESKLWGKVIYRSIYIIPYAIPAFISAVVWRGLLNTEFGQVNRLIEMFGIDGVPWLENGLWAKVAVLLVNTWLGFPYMFLICTGALQSIPSELKEAARVDGASPFRSFRSVTLPLLLVSTAPLLIGSFAFNFNNFVLIFLLTGGGPPVPDSAVPVGDTDILLSFTFDIAVQSGRGQNFGLGSAIVIIIFVIVAALSAFSFRFTRRLEKIYGD